MVVHHKELIPSEMFQSYLSFCTVPCAPGLYKPPPGKCICKLDSSTYAYDVCTNMGIHVREIDKNPDGDGDP